MTRLNSRFRLALAFVLALPGLMLAAWIVPRADPHAEAGIAIDRLEAKKRAQKEARDLGILTDNWTSFVAVRRNEPWRRALDLAKTPGVAWAVPPFSISVLLLSPDRSEFFEAILAPQGHTVGHRSRCDVRRPGAEEALDAQAAAERVLERRLEQGFVRQKALRSMPEAAGVGKGGQGFEATLSHPGYPDVAFNLTIRIAKGHVAVDMLEAVLPRVHGLYGIARSPVAQGIRYGLIGLFVLALLVFGVDYVRRLGDGEVAWARCLGLMVFLLVVFSIIGGLASDHWFVESLEAFETLGLDLTHPHVYFSRFLTLVPALAGALILGVAWCRCESAARERFSGKWTSLDALLAGQVFSRNTAMAFLLGLALAGWVITLPNLVWLLPWPGSGIMGPGLDRLDSLLMKIPSFAALVMPLASTIPLALLGLFAPLPYLRRWSGSTKRALWILAAGLSLYFFYDSVVSAGFDAPLPAAALVAVLKSVTFLLPFIWFDVLTAFFAVLAGRSLCLLIYLHHQPSGSLQNASDWGLGIIAATAIGALWIVLTKETLSDDDVRPRYVDNLRKRWEREVELKHFHAARSRLLPRQEPKIPATQIAAWARPIHHHGADFHDVFDLSDGRVGILMAELGGQPFEGALAIPLIKGFLISHTRRHTDPEKIVRDFDASVTLPSTALRALGFSTFDPATGIFRFASYVAQPPILVWRATRRNAFFLAGPDQVVERSNEDKIIHLGPGDVILLATNRIFASKDPRARSRDLLMLLRYAARFRPRKLKWFLVVFRLFAGLTGSLVVLRPENLASASASRKVLRSRSPSVVKK